ncbi:MAG: hypothetical protein HY362_04790 [Candidatus Aenigmarchaeota archaeon]|nr:hypothetical protein [Candidatus Aenigmarchaeota archaeon]
MKIILVMLSLVVVAGCTIGSKSVGNVPEEVFKNWLVSSGLFTTDYVNQHFTNFIVTGEVKVEDKCPSSKIQTKKNVVENIITLECKEPNENTFNIYKIDKRFLGYSVVSVRYSVVVDGIDLCSAIECSADIYKSPDGNMTDIKYVYGVLREYPVKVSREQAIEIMKRDADCKYANPSLSLGGPNDRYTINKGLELSSYPFLWSGAVAVNGFCSFSCTVDINSGAFYKEKACI